MLDVDGTWGGLGMGGDVILLRRSRLPVPRDDSSLTGHGQGWEVTASYCVVHVCLPLVMTQA